MTPVTGQVYCEVARSSAADIEKALDAAHAARASWGATSVADRSNLLLKIADRVEQNLEMLAVAETWENGKAVRETLNADLPLFVTTSAILRAASGPRKAALLNWMRQRPAITSTSPTAWWARSFPGTSPC